MTIEIKILGPDDKSALANVAPGVFDNQIHDRWSSEFLNDPRHHLSVAIEQGTIVGFASAVHYVHPDKQPELWINEIGVAATHRNIGLGKKLLRALFEVGRGLGCREAWVLTDRSNLPAIRLYASVGGVEPPGDVVFFTFGLEEATEHPGQLPLEG
jgi:aminoglycoside 6'-N-acetyltransferase I